jgi:arabinose-5-phosphate isomerase
MKNIKKEDIIKSGRDVVRHEANTINNLIDCIDNVFADVVELIAMSSGRIVITGIGKSANIAQKIVATFNSTGTPSIFMHAADAIHGDLGIIQSEDIVICLSKSGSTPEIKVLIPLIKSRGNTLIAIVNDPESFLAKSSDYVLKLNMEEEACPDNLVPTSSTTAQLVLGDALAISLLKVKGFTMNDFARFHPGGSLGKKLYMRVDDLYKLNETPVVNLNDKISRIIQEITGKRLGATAVVDAAGNLSGIITDGDLRRMLENIKGKMENLTAEKIMSKNPKTVQKGEMAVNALAIIKQNNISQVIVCNKKKYLGMIHFHDLMREGIV